METSHLGSLKKGCVFYSTCNQDFTVVAFMLGAQNYEVTARFLLDKTLNLGLNIRHQIGLSAVSSLSASISLFTSYDLICSERNIKPQYNT